MKLLSLYIDAVKQDVDFIIGCNAQENFDLIDASEPHDVWFHVEGLPSEHVVACLPTDIPLDKKQLGKIVKQGAVLCKQFSKYASQKKLPIVYTQIKFLEKMEKVGCVLNKNPKIVVI
jgi:hypothetical protein